MERVIDIYNHFMPPRYFQRFGEVVRDKGMAKRMGGIAMLHDLEARMRMMDRWPGYQQVLAPAPPPPESFGSAAASIELTRIGNDGLAEICARHPDRFPAFVAAVPMNDVPAALAEIERAITQLDARGIQLFTHVNGRPLDDPEFLPVFEAMATRYRLPILLHPVRTPATSDYAAEPKSRFEIWQVLGWPHDTSVALARLVFSGMLDRFPELTVVSHHLGGTVPYLEGRLGPLWDQLGSRTADEDYSALLASMKRRPVDYFRMFHGDTVVGGSEAALRCGLSFFGVGHVLFGSDCPFDPEGGPMFIRENLRAVDALELPAADRRKLLSGNAASMLRLAS